MRITIILTLIIAQIYCQEKTDLGGLAKVGKLDGVEITLAKEMQVKDHNVKMYLGKIGEDDKIVLNVQDGWKIADNKVRVMLVKSGYNGLIKPFIEAGCKLQGAPPQIEGDIPDVVEYEITGTNADASSTFLIKGASVFKSNYIAVQIVCVNRESYNKFVTLIKTIE